MADAKKAPLFNCRLTKATGENEAAEVTFVAADTNELRARLGQAGKVLNERVQEHNQRVLDSGEVVKAQLSALRAELRAEVEKEVRDEQAAGVVAEMEHRPNGSAPEA